jgi:outer membrane usher protein
LKKIILSLISSIFLIANDDCELKIKKITINNINYHENFTYECNNNLYLSSNLLENLLKKSILIKNIKKINNMDFINISNINSMKRKSYNDNEKIIFTNNNIFKNNQIFDKKNNNDKISNSLNGFKYNYDFDFNIDRNQNQVIYTLNNHNDLTIFFKDGSFFKNTFLLSSIENKHFTRLNNYYQKDFIDNLYSIRIGDNTTNNGEWVNKFRYGGFKFYKNFKLQPNIVTYPYPDLSVSSIVPTNVEIYINEMQKTDQSISPGNYFFNYLPDIKGENDIKLISKDIFGREKEIKLNFYSSLDLLKPGVYDYSFDLGFLRKNYTLDDFNYNGGFLFNYKYRYGINNSLTLENAGFFIKDTIFNGLTLKKSIYEKLLLSISVAMNSKDISDSLFRISLKHSNKIYSIKGILETADESFYKNEQVNYYQKKLGLIWRYKLPLNLGSVNSNYFENFKYSNITNNIETNELFTFNYNKLINKKYMLSLNFSRNRDKQNDKFFYGINLNIPLYKAYKNSSLTSKTTNKNMSLNFSKNKSSQNILGNSYNIDYTKDYESNENINIKAKQYFKHFIIDENIYYYNSNKNIDKSRFDLSINGDIVFAKNNYFFSQHSNNSFGIIEIPNTENINIYSNNNKIGKTNKKGLLFIPSLTPYYNNQIRLETIDIPFNKEFTEKQNIKLKPYINNGNYYKFKFKEINPSYIKVYSNNKYIKSGIDIEIYNNENKLIEKTISGENGIIFMNNLQKGINFIHIKFEDNVEDTIIKLNFIPNKNLGITYIGKYKL